jgi:hypothetical protein
MWYDSALFATPCKIPFPALIVLLGNPPLFSFLPFLTRKSGVPDGVIALKLTPKAAAVNLLG